VFHNLKAGRTLWVISAGLILTGCNANGSTITKPTPANNQIGERANEPELTRANSDAKKESGSNAKGTSKRIVQSFSFAPPSADWVESQGAQGDETFTQAKFKSSSTSCQLDITSIGMPAKGPQATALTKQCETEYAQGMAKNPDKTRVWIKSGFSINRYANPTSGAVSVWCISETCKVRLNYEFGTGTRPEDNVKVADSTTDAFFSQNPNGGAKTK
jgi:hypothetical protein